MKYSEMIQSAKAEGLVSDKAMWKSIEGLDEILDFIEDCYPMEYRKFLRQQHEIFYGPHYNELFAKSDVSQISYTNREGKKCEGAYWTCEQIEEKTKGMTFPAGTNRWDKFVSFNAAKADFCKIFNDDEILKAGHAFYFADEDAPAGKIWKYMAVMVYGKK